MSDGIFGIRELENIFSKIDIAIDEEDYAHIYKVVDGTTPILEIREPNKIDELFTDPHCTNGKDELWKKTLESESPIKTANGLSLDKSDPCISRLLFAKLLRARIMERGSDCYFHRLDDVITYLERNLPYPSTAEDAKLAVLYLLELSAAAFDYECIGFAERARRILQDHPSVDKDFKWFYQLLARYNIGVGHYHLRHYQQAVLEFNYIIYEIKEHQKTNRISDSSRYVSFNGIRFLLLPAVIYRAEIQLKLQLAYHAIRTLNDYPELNDTSTFDYKSIRANLIKIEAFQLMGDLNASKDVLERIWKLDKIFGTNEEFPDLEPGKTTKPKLFTIKPEEASNLGAIKGKLIGLAIDQHLNYLERQYVSLQKQKRNPPDDESNLIKWIEDNTTYLIGLVDHIFYPYFNKVKYVSYERLGFWQQLNGYIGWLIKGVNGDTAERGKQIVQNMDRLRELHNYSLENSWIDTAEAGSGYENTGIDTKKSANNKNSCHICSAVGVDLARLPEADCDEFANSTLELFKVLEGDDHNKRHKFIRRLIEREWQGTDLRIKDLNLRYKYNEEFLSSLLPAGLKAKEYCWGDLNKDNIADLGLLPCTEKPIHTSVWERIKSWFIQKQIPIQRNSGELLSTDHYEQVLNRWESHFLRRLRLRSIHSGHKPGVYFIGLQRWNSSSPAEGYSLGGGYLLYRIDRNAGVDLGIAIDPGFDFIRNLFHMGFTLNDIDMILISHAHIDHIRDFEALVALLLELKKRGKQRRKVHVILSLAVYQKLESTIENPTLRQFIEPYIIDIEREININYFEDLRQRKTSFSFYYVAPSDGDQPENNYRPSVATPGHKDDGKRGIDDVRIDVTQAYHDDSTDYSDSFGFIIDIASKACEGENRIIVGYSGDTKWVYPKIKDPLSERNRTIEDVFSQYTTVDKPCIAVIVHLGSLIKDSTFRNYNCSNGNKCEMMIRDENHPYLVGMLRILSGVHKTYASGTKPLILISEFGEEMRGKIRADLIKRMRQAYGDKMHILPVDVGITVQLQCTAKKESNNKSNLPIELHSLCVQCNQFVPIEETDFEHYGIDEAVFCICKTCKNGTPQNVIQDRLRQLYDIGYELYTERTNDQIDR